MQLHEYEYSTVAPGSRAYLEYLALRHEVFCEELRRVPSSGVHDGGFRVESDAYDVHSVHVLCRLRATGEPVGCSRLILPNPKGLNVTGRYKLSHKPDIPPTRVGEIGRLALSPRLRRCRSESVAHGRRREDSIPGGSAQAPRSALHRDTSTVALGLYREIFRLAHAYGITHCYAAVEPAFARLLNRLGFSLQEAGELNTEVFPPRQPFFMGAHGTRSELASRNSWLYEFMFSANDVTPAQTAAAWPSHYGSGEARTATHYAPS